MHVCDIVIMNSRDISIIVIHPTATSFLVIRQTLLITHDILPACSITLTERRCTSVLAADQPVSELRLMQLQGGYLVIAVNCW